MDLSSVIKSINKVKTVVIDNWTFRVHYKFTSLVFALCFFVTASSQYFGNALQCMKGRGGLNDLEFGAIVSYCWNGKLFIITNPQVYAISIGNQEPQTVNEMQNGSIIKYLTAYRWLPWLLAFHTLSFCLTHYVWKLKEGGTIKKLLCLSMPNDTHENWLERRSAMARKIANGLGSFSAYGWLHVFCEILNVVVAVVNLHWMDYYLDIHYYGLYSIGILPYPGLLDVKRVIWPNAAKCSFSLSGPAASVINWDILCVLGHSYIYREMYTALWFWLALLILISSVALIARVGTMLFRSYQIHAIRNLAGHIDASIVKDIMHGRSFADYLILVNLGQSLSKHEYKELLTAVSYRLKFQV